MIALTLLPVSTGITRIKSWIKPQENVAIEVETVASLIVLGLILSDDVGNEGGCDFIDVICILWSSYRIHYSHSTLDGLEEPVGLSVPLNTVVVQ